MRNPFTDEFGMERQELLNYIFEGRRTKFGRIKLTYEDLNPHILKHYMESLIDAADDLIVDAGNFHNLMNLITHKFIRLLPDLFFYHPISFSSLDEDVQTFIIKIVRNELSFKEIVKKLAKKNFVSQSIFTLRLGGKRIARYALSLLDTRDKLNFLSDIYTEVVNGEFDEEITKFLGEEVEKAEARKKVNSAKRREKKRQQREAAAAKKKEAERRTFEAAKDLIDISLDELIATQNAATAETPRYEQV